MFIPIGVEINLERWPISNFLMIGFCVLVPFLLSTSPDFPDNIDKYVLNGWNLRGMISYQFLHAGFFHLLFNMIYLWIFGNAVCAKTGNLIYPLVFIGLGILSGVFHNVFTGGQAVGASGTVNGMIGFYLVLYPRNQIRMLGFFFRIFTFSMRGIWLILLWFILDIYGAWNGTGLVAYWAHIGGFVSGVILGIAFLKLQWIRMDSYDNPTLLEMTGIM